MSQKPPAPPVSPPRAPAAHVQAALARAAQTKLADLPRQVTEARRAPSAIPEKLPGPVSPERLEATHVRAAIASIQAKYSSQSSVPRPPALPGRAALGSCAKPIQAAAPQAQIRNGPAAARVNNTSAGVPSAVRFPLQLKPLDFSGSVTRGKTTKQLKWATRAIAMIESKEVTVMFRRCRNTMEYEGILRGDLVAAFDRQTGEASTWKWFSFDTEHTFSKDQTDSEHAGGTIRIRIRSRLREWLCRYLFCDAPGYDRKSRDLGKDIEVNNPKIKHEGSGHGFTIGIPKNSWLEFWALTGLAGQDEKKRERVPVPVSAPPQGNGEFKDLHWRWDPAQHTHEAPAEVKEEAIAGRLAHGARVSINAEPYWVEIQRNRNRVLVWRALPGG